MKLFLTGRLNVWKVFNGNHYPGKGGIQPPRAFLTDLMVMEV